MAIKNNNISISDKIFGYIRYLKLLLKTFLAYRRAYQNYLSVVARILRKDYPIEAIMRNGDHFSLTKDILITSLRFHEQVKGARFDIANDIVTFSSLPFMSGSRMEVKLHGGTTNGDVAGIFLDNTYQFLPVRGKTVVDIGANIGDSAIYFILRGANKIVGLEPFTKNYEIARKNIELNNLSREVTLLQAGCGGDTRYVALKRGQGGLIDNASENMDSNHDEQRYRVPLLTLNDILEKNNLSSEALVLKMDCEGCEYEAILSSSKNTLQKFSHIQIEYHYGYRNLKEKLEKCGFNIFIDKPIAGSGFISSDGEERHGRRYRGFLYAQKAR